LFETLFSQKKSQSKDPEEDSEVRKKKRNSERTLRRFCLPNGIRAGGGSRELVGGKKKDQRVKKKVVKLPSYLKTNMELAGGGNLMSVTFFKSSQLEAVAHFKSTREQRGIEGKKMALGEKHLKSERITPQENRRMHSEEENTKKGWGRRLEYDITGRGAFTGGFDREKRECREDPKKKCFH